MCTDRASTTLLYHHDSGNVVRHESPTQQCHQRLKSPGTQHSVRGEGYAILRHIRTTRLQTKCYSSNNLNLQWHGWSHHKSVSLSTMTFMSHAFGTAIYTGRVKLPGGTQQEASQVQHADCALEAMIQTNGMQWLWAQQDEHICLDMITKRLYTPQCRLCVHRRTETNCNSILINKDEVWDLKGSHSDVIGCSNILHCDGVLLGGQFIMFWGFVVPSSLWSSCTRTLQMKAHNPLQHQELIARLHRVNSLKNRNFKI